MPYEPSSQPTRSYDGDKDDCEQSSLLPQSHACQQSTADSKAHVFVPSLEGMRGVAIIMVIICHISKDFMSLLTYHLGRGGVAIFFVLSGYLITGVLLRQQSQSKAVSKTYAHLPKFYMDRFVRLYPALAVEILITGSLYSYIKGAFPDKMPMQAFFSLIYISNFDDVAGLRPGCIWLNTWSLSVEEQFYILWSLLLPQVQKLTNKSRTISIGGMILLSYVLHFCEATRMVKYLPYWSRSWASPFSNFWKILIGALLRLSKVPPGLTHPIACWAGFFILAISLLLTSSRFASGLRSFGPRPEIYLEGIAVLSASLMITGTMRRGNKILENEVLRFIGRVSYSFYLYQSPLLYCLTMEQGRRDFAGVGVSALALVAATLSTLYLEEPIRTWYKRRKALH